MLQCAIGLELKNIGYFVICAVPISVDALNGSKNADVLLLLVILVGQSGIGLKFIPFQVLPQHSGGVIFAVPFTFNVGECSVYAVSVQPCACFNS